MGKTFNKKGLYLGNKLQIRYQSWKRSIESRDEIYHTLRYIVVLQGDHRKTDVDLFSRFSRELQVYFGLTMYSIMHFGL